MTEHTSTPDLSVEQWKPAFPCGCYFVSDKGRVRRSSTGIVLAPVRDRLGYVRLTLSHCGKRRSTYVHQLVADAFLSPRPPGMVPNHKNFITNDNRAANLEWLTPADNLRHASRHGRMTGPRGERCAQSKLTLEQVDEIRRRLRAGESHRALARSFGVSKSNIGFIGAGKSWKHAS
jgi:hypothetical protein